MIKELDTVVLKTDLPDEGLLRGDIGTVVLKHAKGAGFDVEFITLDGATVAVVTLAAGQVRPIRQGEIPHARAVA